MRLPRGVPYLCAAIAATAMAQGPAPALVNPSFEQGEPGKLPSGWMSPDNLSPAPVAEDVACTGRRSAAFLSGAPAQIVRQELTEPGRQPVIVSGYFRADGLAFDAAAERLEYARLYVHVLYADRPYADASHFWTDIPPGTYDWRRVAVSVRPKPDLEPAQMWVSVAARPGSGTLYADDLEIEVKTAFAGGDAAAWQRVADAALISDLSVCTPAEALSETRRRGRWKVMDYETQAFAGKCLWALPDTGAAPVTLPLGVSGWHAVYLGLASQHGGGNRIRVKLTDDLAFQHRSHKNGVIEEVFFRCADLTGQSLHVAQQSAGHSAACVLMYVRLVPLTDAEVAQVTHDAAQRETKRLIATIDGFSFMHERRPTTREELLEEFEHYRDTDFGTIWWAAATGADTVNYKSALGTVVGAHTDDFPRRGDRYYTEAVKELIDAGIDISEVAVEAARSMDAEIHFSLRPAGWQGPAPYDEYFTSDFYDAHPEWRCYDRDGTAVLRMSFAVPEVRRHLLGICREMLEAEPDGLVVLYNRGMPVILWEDAFCEMFRERYDADAKNVPEDDVRLYELRAEILTAFMREIRQLLDETQQTKKLGRRLKLSAMVLETEADNRKFGLDVERWVSDGLIDVIGVYKGSCHASGKPIDMAYFKRITDGTNVPVHPCLIAWALPSTEAMLKQTLEWYDAGADGVLFWDPSGMCCDGVRWPIMSRLGHDTEVRQRALEGKPSPVSIGLKRLGNHILGRWSAWAGF